MHNYDRRAKDARNLARKQDMERRYKEKLVLGILSIAAPVILLGVVPVVRYLLN